MAGTKQKAYDDDELVAAIASGATPHTQIAKAFGLSPTMVHLIAKGRRRPELRARIEAATAEFRDRAHRLLAHVSASAVARLGKLISDEDQVKPEVQLKAAVEVLGFALGKPFPAEPPVGEQFATDPLARAAEEYWGLDETESAAAEEGTDAA